MSRGITRRRPIRHRPAAAHNSASITSSPRFFGPAPETWDGFQAVGERFLDAGDHVIVTGRFTGRAKAGGGHLDAPFAMVFEMHAGRVGRVDQYTDTLLVARALEQ